MDIVPTCGVFLFLGGTMIDIKLIRENPELVKENIKKKFQDEKLVLVDEVKKLDEEVRENKAKGDALRAERNKVSKKIGALMGQGKKEEAEEVKKSVVKIGDEIKWGLTNSLFPKIAFVSNKDDFDDERSYKVYKRMHDIMMKVIDKEKGHFFWTPRHRYSFDKSSLKKYVKRMSNDKLSKDDVEKVSDMMMYCSINTFLDSLNFYMLHFSKKLTYVMPLRAIVQRYYRYNNYAVDSIDADGGNLPMFFNGLSDEAFEDFNKRWLLPIFKFELKLRPSGDGHVELLVKEKDKEERNLIDVGFGYTQILPILTILWKAIMLDCISTDEKDDFCKSHIIAIEQPELHLHPRFQGMFVDMLDKVISICHEKKKDVRIIIETHSEVIINRLGIKVMDEKSYLKSNDVNVILFNAKEEGYETDIVSSSYDEQGYLTNWPFGFFSDNVY